MKAKEMFEELGYKMTMKTKKVICYDINNELERRAIWFCIPSKRFIIGAYQYVTLKELKAINKQIEELGWLE